VLTLRTYLNSPRNIVYFYTLHNCNIDSATNILLCMNVQDVKIRNLALSSDALDDNRFARCVVEAALFRSFERLCLSVEIRVVQQRMKSIGQSLTWYWEIHKMKRRRRGLRSSRDNL
jgi:hypothetical protein